MKQLLLIIAILAIILVTPIAAQPRSVTLQAVDAVPEGARQLLQDPGFNLEDAESEWQFFGDCERSPVDAMEGPYSLWQGGANGWGLALAPLDLALCEPGPVWIEIGRNTQTTLPLADPGYDVTEGSLHTMDGASLIRIWQWYDYDYTDGWEFPVLFQVDNLFDVLDGDRMAQLYIASSTNETPTDFRYEVWVWCQTAYSHQVYLPFVVR